MVDETSQVIGRHHCMPPVCQGFAVFLNMRLDGLGSSLLDPFTSGLGLAACEILIYRNDG